MSTAIPKDSLVLVTGVSGFIGSHVADQLLLAGYRVRGTTRDVSKVKTLSSLWESKYGKNRIEFVAVPDMAAPDAYREAVKGSPVFSVALKIANLPYEQAFQVLHTSPPT
jgi:nucleoside-diphosphate-sugar epimerase